MVREGSGASLSSSSWIVESERSSWPRVVRRPHGLLRGLLAPQAYSGYDHRSGPHQLLLPATLDVVLVIKLAESAERPPGFLLGAHGGHVVVAGDCATSYLEVRMAPLGAYRLLGRPVAGLGAEIVDLEGAFGGPGRRLVEAVQEARSWTRRFALVDEFLLDAAERGRRPSPEVVHAWARIVEQRGAVRIGELARTAGCSHQNLIRRFGDEVGVTPKKAARLVRFEHVLRGIRERRTSWDRVAADGGYADQAHMIREFRAFTGLTPTGYAARTVPR
jgi:AraC-like DNA-binding protein